MMPKPDKKTVQQISDEIYTFKKSVTTREVRDELLRRGYSFGETDVLVDYAELDMTNKLISQLTNAQGKKLYISTQVAFDFGVDYAYRRVEDIKAEHKQEEYSTSWLQKQLISLVKRTPLLPEWAIRKIVVVINEVFTELRKAS